MTTEKSTVALEQIGRYRVTGELGRGGMGIVYRGEDRLIGREVAIKTLTEVTPELRERFYLEARSGILSHPNIVTVYELGEHEGNPFIAMEFIAGESLEMMLRTRKKLSLLEALSVVEQLCAGLGYAHGHGVVHRDVKPANVLLQPDGRVTIVDFGIARLADQTRQLTKTDALLGTFHYIAPERLKGEASDGRADVWSVGVMLYEMLTGELPFKGKDVSSLYRVIHEPYVPLTEYLQDLPEGLSNVLDRALAKSVEDRYATAEEMAFDLQVVAETLKHDRVNTLLENARRLADERQFASARTVLLQAQRIDPGNADAKALISDVQDRLNHLQRGEQLRQIVEQAQDALTDRRWDDAVTFFQQAQKLDTENTLGLEERLQDAQEQRVQQQKIVSLWEQASDARSRGDLTKAQECLGAAIEIDDRNTDLRNAYSVILREIKRRQQSTQVDELLRTARENYGSRQYTEAIAQLREAAEIDPSHAEVQQLLFTAATRQKEERRQLLLEKIAAEIQESLDREDFSVAQARVTRALETLPGDGTLLRLKAETEQRKREFDTSQIVRSAVLESQDLVADNPAQALKVIERGLEQAPESETLQQSRSRLLEHLRGLEANSSRADALQKAHAAMDARRFAEAGRILESAIAEYGSNEDLNHLLVVAKTEQAKDAQKQAEIREQEEIQAAIATAVAASDKALAGGDFKRSTRAIDALSKKHPANETVTQARLQCESKRRSAAEQRVQEALQAAEKAREKNATKEAANLLRRAEEALSFTSAATQNAFARAKENLEKTAPPAKQKKATPAKTPSGGKGKWYAAAGAAGLIAVLGAAVGVSHAHHEQEPPKVAVAAATVAPVAAPAPVLTYMSIDASPWATVLHIEDEAGVQVPLPEGDQTTPLRLDGLKAGKYKVTLRGDNADEQTVDCTVSADDHLCTATLSTPDLQKVLTGDQP